MHVSECMSSDVRLCAPNDTIQQAAVAMMEIDAGSLPVGENDRLVGIITDRDIAVRAVAKGLGPDTTVRDAMSPGICYCFEDADVDDAAEQMRDLKVRRMPVLNKRKRLVGILSLADIARSHEDGAGAALRDISEPGGQHSQH